MMPSDRTDLEYEAGVLTAGVIDGITVGHVCCSVHDCKVPVARQNH